LPGPDKRVGEIYRTKNLQDEDESVPPALFIKQSDVVFNAKVAAPVFPRAGG
jgi:hypothetical protein